LQTYRLQIADCEAREATRLNLHSAIANP
jgi:hypothetical protein